MYTTLNAFDWIPNEIQFINVYNLLKTMIIYCLFVKTSLSAKPICMKISCDYRFNLMQNDFHDNSLAFGLVLKQRHKGLGNDLLSTTNGKDSIPQKRCLLLIRILTDSS